MQSLSSFRKTPSNRSMGIEIETIVPDEAIIASMEYRGFFYVTHDESIECSWREQQGFEFVSMPLTPTWLKREIDRLFKGIGETMPNETCGIHIHVSRKWLSTDKAKAIYNFVHGLDDDVFETFFGRMPNIYCNKGLRWDVSRYQAINNENKNTIEFRMFASGGATWAKYCVDCVEYMINNAYRLNVEAFLAFRDMYGELK